MAKKMKNQSDKNIKSSQGKEGTLKDLAKDIVASYTARIKIVSEIVKDTQAMMDNFRQRREEMSWQLQEVLARCQSLRRKDFDRLMADIVARHSEREEEVKKMLEDFRQEEEMVAGKLRSLLEKGEQVRVKDLKKIMAAIRLEQERRAEETSKLVGVHLQKMRREVHVMLDNFKKERQSVAIAWQEALKLLRQEKKHGQEKKTKEDKP